MYTTEVSWQVVSEPKENKGRLTRGAAELGVGKTGGESPGFGRAA